MSTDFAPVQENVLTKIYGVPSCGPSRIWPNRTIATVMDWNAKKNHKRSKLAFFKISYYFLFFNCENFYKYLTFFVLFAQRLRQ